MVLIISSSGGVGPKGKINCMYKRSVWQFYIVTLLHCTLYVHCTLLHCTLLHCTLHVHCTSHVYCTICLSGNCTLHIVTLNIVTLNIVTLCIVQAVCLAIVHCFIAHCMYKQSFLIRLCLSVKEYIRVTKNLH